MTGPALIPAMQADALAGEIAAQAGAECDARMADAAREADALVAAARRTARTRMHQALAELRREGLNRMTQARAQIETEQRRREQEAARAALDEGWPVLEHALAARWQDPDGRAAWADAATACALERIRTAQWRIVHPADWPDSERERLRARLGGAEFIADDGLEAGLRFEAGSAILDATPAGLLADRALVAALLLAELDRGAP